MEKVRIQKFLSDAGVASRRAAEAAVAEGAVTVNGRVCAVGQKVGENDVIVYRGRRVRYINKKKIYIMLNKPRGYITTNDDENGRKCTADLVADLNERVYPVGRLDRDSEGLLILTNDGELANRLMHPSHEIPKIYNVRVRGAVTEEQLGILRSALDIDGYIIKPVNVEIIGYTEVSTLLRFRLYEGRNRQIRKMCEKASLEVSRLTRIAIGDISIGDLKPGKYRDLSPAEIDYLYGKNKKQQKNDL